MKQWKKPKLRKLNAKKWIEQKQNKIKKIKNRIGKTQKTKAKKQKI